MWMFGSKGTNHYAAQEGMISNDCDMFDSSMGHSKLLEALKSADFGFFGGNMVASCKFGATKSCDLFGDLGSYLVKSNLSDKG